MVDLPKFSIKDLLETGVHYGHKTMRWNPRMAPYLFGSRNGIHIIDLQQTVPLLHRALNVVYEVVKNNGRVLFVGTKRQASEPIAEAAKRCGQYYVNHRWLGGMLTNWKTVSLSIKTLRTIEGQLADRENSGLTKKEILGLERDYAKLQCSLGGIVNMGGKPDLLFIIDTNKESLAMAEAKKLGIPVVAILDSNSDPEGVDFPIPGNDDATRAIDFYCKLISDAALLGISEGLSAAGVDMGSKADLVKEVELTEKDVKKISSKKKVTAVAAKKEAVKVEEKKPSKTVAKKPAAKVASEKSTKTKNSEEVKKAVGE